MKSLYVTILLPLLLLFAGCGKDDTLPQPITGRFDPIFAQVLQERGYIADADRIALDEVKEITDLDLSGQWDPELQKYDGPLTSLRGIEYFESLKKLNCVGNRLTSLDISNNTNLRFLLPGNNPGDGTQFFPVTAWFDNDHIPEIFPTGSWDYNGTTITIDYRKAE